MLGQTIALLALAGIAQSACFNATMDGGLTSVFCKDETTGVSFDYVDFEGRYPMTSGKLSTQTLAKVYADYLSGVSNATAPVNSVRRTPNKKRAPGTLTGYWEDCKHEVEGVCADDHVITWKGSADYYIAKLTHMMHFANGERMRNNPRNKCTNWHHGGTICLQWVFNVVGHLTDGQIDSMAHNTWHHCQSHKDSCQTRFKNGHSPYCNYFCVSDRGTGCVVNYTIDNCKNIPPPPPF